jgi:hypothetical protein
MTTRAQREYIHASVAEHEARKHAAASGKFGKKAAAKPAKAKSIVKPPQEPHDPMYVADQAAYKIPIGELLGVGESSEDEKAAIGEPLGVGESSEDEKAAGDAGPQQGAREVGAERLGVQADKASATQKKTRIGAAKSSVRAQHKTMAGPNTARGSTSTEPKAKRDTKAGDPFNLRFRLCKLIQSETSPSPPALVKQASSEKPGRLGQAVLRHA